MLPGYGSVVANASGIGVQDKVPYCGHGGAGGVISPAALFCWAFSLMFGMRMGFADAADAAISEPASTRVTDAANRRECFNKTASRAWDAGSSASIAQVRLVPPWTHAAVRQANVCDLENLQPRFLNTFLAGGASPLDERPGGAKNGRVMVAQGAKLVFCDSCHSDVPATRNPHRVRNTTAANF